MWDWNGKPEGRGHDWKWGFRRRPWWGCPRSSGRGSYCPHGGVSTTCRDRAGQPGPAASSLRGTDLGMPRVAPRAPSPERGKGAARGPQGDGEARPPAVVPAGTASRCSSTPSPQNHPSPLGTPTSLCQHLKLSILFKQLWNMSFLVN